MVYVADNGSPPTNVRDIRRFSGPAESGQTPAARGSASPPCRARGERARKTPAEVHREIRSAQGDNDPYGRARRFAPLWLAVPAIVRRFALTRLLANPHRRKRFTGTAAVTALSMFGKGTGWGIPFISHSICLTVGGVGRKPGLGPDGKVEPREMLCLTISVDHDVVNGAPLARFISRLRESVESAVLLDD